MKAFEYAAPRDEAALLDVMLDEPGATEVIAGGTDLVGLMKKMIVTPERVVNIKEIPSLRGIARDSSGVTMGAVTNLDDMLDSPDLDDYPAIKQVIARLGSMQLAAQGTLGGELCQRPRCWYFRDGVPLLEAGERAAEGENRYHAILGNAGRARHVNPSRLAPALIALGAQVRIIGPAEGDETRVPLEAFYHTPRSAQQRENILASRQVVAQVHLPPADGVANASYEVRFGEGPDSPLAAAAAALRIEAGIVRQASVVMGQVAPIPWISSAAVEALLGKPVNEQTADEAGRAAVARATPLSDNAYKVQLARVAVKRAILRAAGMAVGGFE